MRARLLTGPEVVVRERLRIERQYAESAREVFTLLRPVLLASRPIVGDQKPVPGADGVNTPLRPIYGKPTFRNVFDKNGQHV